MNLSVLHVTYVTFILYSVWCTLVSLISVFCNHFFLALFPENAMKDIGHQWDVWHGAKNLGKKLQAVSGINYYGNKCLYGWSPQKLLALAEYFVQKPFVQKPL